MIRIAIDGPSGAGKSTVAKLLAKRLGISYVDTGAMYRAAAYKLDKEGISEKDQDKISKEINGINMDFDGERIFLDGEDVSDKIRTDRMSLLASKFSSKPEVRKKLTEMQREIANNKSVVMDGRDICDNIMPFAEWKFYITASPEERARRRYEELSEKGIITTFDETLESIKKRDYDDSHRQINPLKISKDAEVIDTTNMGIEATVDLLYGKMI